MGCTTILVGKNASYDGSTIIARNDDAPAGNYMPKKFIVVNPDEQPRHYKSVLSHVEIELPDQPLRYTCMPNAVDGEGIWAATGVNELNVGMTATETITSNERVLGADPLVIYDKEAEQPGGIGEEDIVLITLPYIRSAREGVKRLGHLLETYGTYEMNGIAFQDVNEIWWLETIGGHHWMAKRVPDDHYVVMPNQQGIDEFDLDDAFGPQVNHMCSADLREFIVDNHLDLNLDGHCNPRWIFGSHNESDHIYNTPRAWYIERYFNPRTYRWDGEQADYMPESNDIPWMLVPEHKLTVEDIKFALSSHFQGTPYDPYDKGPLSNKYRSVGVNRTDFLGLIQMRPYGAEECQAIQWIAVGSNVFNTLVPFYTNVTTTPDYVANTNGTVSTENFYWSTRLIGALADASFASCHIHIERYQMMVMSKAHALLNKYDTILKETPVDKRQAVCIEANQKIADMLKEETTKVLDKVLYERSCQMKNAFARSDA
ncbi:MAG: C69 family dipeptidase [Erysipelotrichaceae bacterium]|nr:C69 family dipeptidase [Erysipelotrichaceae bacterium]